MILQANIGSSCFGELELFMTHVIFFAIVYSYFASVLDCYSCYCGGFVLVCVTESGKPKTAIRHIVHEKLYLCRLLI